MANIKVGELRDLQKEFVKDTEIINFHGLEIEIKQYLPMEKKLELAYTIYNSCIDKDNGLLVVNENSMDIIKTYFITQYYTNLTLPKDYFEGADLLISTGLYEVIKENIKDEINRIEDIIANIKMQELVKYEQENSIQYIIKDTLNQLIEKIPTSDEAKKFVEEASKEINNFDPDKLKFIKDFLVANSGGKVDGLQDK